MVSNIQIEQSKRSILEARFETINFASKILCPFLKTKDTHYCGHELSCYIPTRRIHYHLFLPRPKIKIKTAVRQSLVWQPGRGDKIRERSVPTKIRYPLFCNMGDANEKLYLFGEIVRGAQKYIGNCWNSYQKAKEDKELSDLVRELQEKSRIQGFD